MISLAPISRTSLSDYPPRILVKEDGDLYLNMTEYFTTVFEHLIPGLMKYSNTGWRIDPKRKFMRYAYFKKPDNQLITSVTAIQSAIKDTVFIGLNPHLQNNFLNEIDFCFALDYHYDNSAKKRTKYGTLIYKAKNSNDQSALTILAAELQKNIQLFIKPSDLSNYMITHIPCHHIQGSQLSKNLALQISVSLNIGFIDCTLKHHKPELKNATIDKKHVIWQSRMDGNDIVLSTKVNDKKIIVIDDLYQSGTSMWSTAKFLKQTGAREVIGIACVKTLRDTDNQ